jgi:hypothetical protein
MGLAMTAPAAARPLPIRCGAAGLLLCGLWPLVPLIGRLDYPPTVPSGVREALAAGYPRVRPGDSVCMLGYSFELNDYYQTRFNFSRQNVHEISLDCGGEAQDAAQCAATGGRVWVVVSDTVPGCPAAPKRFRDAMDRLARRADYQESGDTYMALYVH